MNTNLSSKKPSANPKFIFKVYIIMLLVGYCGSINVLAQKGDSINFHLNSLKTDAAKIEYCLKKSDELKTEDFDKTIQIATTGIKLAQKNNNIFAEADFWRQKGNAYYFKGNYQKSTPLYYKALELLKPLKISSNLGRIQNDIGRLYRKIDDFPRAIKFYEEALETYRNLNDEEGIATIYNESGVVYDKMKNYPEAIRRYQLSLSLQEKRGDLVGQSYALEFIGNSHLLQKKYAESERYLLRSLAIRQKLKDDFSIALNLNALGNLYFEEEQFELSEKNFLESNLIADKLHYLDLRKSNYDQLAKLYRKVGKDDLAFQNLEKSQEINEKIFKKDHLKQVEELSTKYETAEKDNQILAQNSKIFQRNVALFTLTLLLVLGFIFYKNYQNKQKLKLQKEILHQQDLATRAVMNAEDNERKRMATHLHDGIGQLLTAANMNISVLDDYKNDQTSFSKILEKTKKIMSEAMTDVRTLSHQIMPNMLIKNSLADALRELISKSDSPKLHINLHIEGLQNDIDQNVQIVMYRIIQECINNTLKHAEASEVEISVVQKNALLLTSIKDNGIGFNPAKITTKNEGLGLNNIRSRIEVLKGELDVESSEGNGTNIKMKIPL